MLKDCPRLGGMVIISPVIFFEEFLKTYGKVKSKGPSWTSPAAESNDKFSPAWAPPSADVSARRSSDTPGLVVVAPFAPTSSMETDCCWALPFRDFGRDALLASLADCWSLSAFFLILDLGPMSGLAGLFGPPFFLSRVCFETSASSAFRACTCCDATTETSSTTTDICDGSNWLYLREVPPYHLNLD